MASTLQIAGPCEILVGGTQLGYSDNDNLPSVSFTDHVHEVKTVLSGANPEEIVTHGTSARISLALVKWDQAVLNTLLLAARGATQGTSVVGQLQIGGSNMQTVVLRSVGGSPTAQYSFPFCYLTGDAITDSQWGNRERVLTLTFNAIPNASNVLYTYTA